MEGAPPEAKRPRLFEALAPEGGLPRPESIPLPLPWGPLPPRAPLLGGPLLCQTVMPREPERKAGGGACKKRAPSAAGEEEENPSPKARRRGPWERRRGLPFWRQLEALLGGGARILVRPPQLLLKVAAPPPPALVQSCRSQARPRLRTVVRVPWGRGPGLGRLSLSRMRPSQPRRLPAAPRPGHSGSPAAPPSGPRPARSAPGSRYVEAGQSPDPGACLWGGACVLARPKAFREGGHRADGSPDPRGRAIASGTGHSVQVSRGRANVVEWKFRERSQEDWHPSPEMGSRRPWGALGKGRRGALWGNCLCLTFKGSNSAFNLNVRYEHRVSCYREGKEGNYVSEVTATCYIVTAGALGGDRRKFCEDAVPVIPEDTLFSLVDTFENVSLLNHFGDTYNSSSFKRDDNNNSSSEKSSTWEALDVLHIRDLPQGIPQSQVNTTEHGLKTNTNPQDTVMEKKHTFNKSSFHFKGKFHCFLDIEQQMKHHYTIYTGLNTITKTQEEFVGNVVSELKENIQNLIWNERKHPTDSFMGMCSYRISSESERERDQKYSIATYSTMVCTLTSNLLMEREPTLQDAREIKQGHANQNNTADRKEHHAILQERASANSEHFHPDDESTEFVNQKFKTYLATRNNEYSPDLRAECLSTETKTMSDFKMKGKFDIVLKELCTFFEIGKEEETSANSSLFQLKNESTEFNHKLKTDWITRNNKCSLDIKAKCLSTEMKTVSDFRMKSEFDIVLQELRLFHEIGKEEEASCIGETRKKQEKDDFDKDNSMEEVHQKTNEDLTVVSLEKIHTASPCDTITSVKLPKTAQSSFKWKKIHMEQKKEVPHGYCPSSPSDDELLLLPSGRDFEKAFSLNPVLFSDDFMDGRIQSLLKGGSGLSHGIVRVYPLKTCSGPIRIGLSRKAKPKQLHPYLK